MVIALSVDARYANGAAVVLASLCKWNTKKRELEVWIIHSGLDSNVIGLLRRAATPCSALNLYQIRDNCLNLPVRSDYITAATFGRLFLGEALPSQVTRVLYLDSDVLVTGDLMPLWECRLGSNVIAAVPEATAPVIRGPKTYEHLLDPNLDPSQPYFNAGVLLVNLAEWRRRGVGEHAVQYLRRYSPPLMDQDALNAGLAATWLPLDRIWNVTTFWFRTRTRQRRYRKLLEAARIVHFVGHRKPWLRPEVWKGAEWHAHLGPLIEVSDRGTLESPRGETPRL